jgi:hypothetical protein
MDVLQITDSVPRVKAQECLTVNRFRWIVLLALVILAQG